jgi:hypothetical protein
MTVKPLRYYWQRYGWWPFIVAGIARGYMNLVLLLRGRK